MVPRAIGCGSDRLPVVEAHAAGAGAATGPFVRRIMPFEERIVKPMEMDASGRLNRVTTGAI
jgi:hypothetical protein